MQSWKLNSLWEIISSVSEASFWRRQFRHLRGADGCEVGQQGMDDL